MYCSQEKNIYSVLQSGEEYIQCTAVRRRIYSLYCCQEKDIYCVLQSGEEYIQCTAVRRRIYSVYCCQEKNKLCTAAKRSIYIVYCSQEKGVFCTAARRKIYIVYCCQEKGIYYVLQPGDRYIFCAAGKSLLLLHIISGKFSFIKLVETFMEPFNGDRFNLKLIKLICFQ